MPSTTVGGHTDSPEQGVWSRTEGTLWLELFQNPHSVGRKENNSLAVSRAIPDVSSKFSARRRNGKLCQANINKDAIFIAFLKVWIKKNQGMCSELALIRRVAEAVFLIAFLVVCAFLCNPLNFMALAGI